ncbi:MAG TPA: YopX family protein, partial [Chitinophagales bacterium]|nr:YopX family protein [Chitinophagales bacterium]
MSQLTNREMKFRAWDATDKKFVSSDMVLNPVIPVAATKRGFKLDTVFMLQPFTGLRDCNNREIYEGDIVRYSLSGLHDDDPKTEYVEAVEFVNGCFETD